jgi:hypothetical protein
MKDKSREQLALVFSGLSEGQSQSSKAPVQSVDSESKKDGRWTIDEHFRFIEAL